MSHWIEQHWQRLTPVSAALLPLGLLFGGIVRLRRRAYELSLLRQRQLPVPVIVIGNISVGGTGKTPLTIYLASRLRQLGLRPGIISRGYGGSAQQPTSVTSDSPAALVGDEPILIARHTGCPVFVCRDRAAAGAALLAAHPHCNLLLCDDGMQHYQLARDLEIAVVDAARGFGNSLPLPAGPLREMPARLGKVSAIVTNGPGTLPLPAEVPIFRMQLRGSHCYRLNAPHETCAATELNRGKVMAVAGIGNPQRFFSQLHSLGLTAEHTAFADHHAFTPTDLVFPGYDTILLTEKDAVKCAGFKDDRIWVFPVSAELEPDLAQFIVHRLQQHGLETA